MQQRKHRFFNTYLTATISVALVLFLVGLECVLGLSAKHLLTQVKESTTLTVVLADSTSSADSLRLASILDAAPFCKSQSYISKEEALEQHISELGEDPTLFLGYNPIRAAIEVKVAADYVDADSLAQAVQLLNNYPFVEQVTYPRVVVGFFSQNVSTISMMLLIIAAVLLLISIVLIVNTIRLTVYSRRFLIHTMKLVGATPWIIKGPIVRRSIIMGFAAAILALLMIAAVVYLAFYRFGFWLFPIQWEYISLIAIVVITAGLLITFFSTVFAVNRYIRMKVDDLYFI